MTEVIFHLTLASELATGSVEGHYRPARFAEDGFIHCAGDAPTCLQVAESSVRDAAEPVLVLRIERERLTCPCRFEAPAPLPGGGAHRTPGKTFPHLYGPLNLDAVSGCAPLERTPAGAFRWPEQLDADGPPGA